VTFATKNLKARCDVARQSLWRYIKDRHRSCDDTWSSATNLKKYYYLTPLVAELHVSKQLSWRYWWIKFFGSMVHRLFVEAVRVLVEAVRVIIEAVRKIIEAMRLFVEAVRVLVQ
jgi:hypothetical protein